MKHSLGFSSLIHDMGCKSFVVIVAILCVVQIHGTEGLSRDGLALLDFKNGLQSPAAALSNWRASDPSPCNWEGVNCSGSTGVVSSLFLPSAGLVGSISPSLGELKGLQNLTLTNNTLSGPIPRELGNCSNLIILALDHNNLTGEIPPELGNCTSLQVLAIQSNQLNGTLPHQIYNISSLWGFYVNNNNLVGNITEDLEYLAQLPNIYDIWMQFNSFSGTIPVGIKQASRLNNLLLNFQSNGSGSFGGLIPKELGQLPNLVDLDLRDNSFIGNIPPELGNISTLQYLLLSTNKLTGPIPPELGNLTSLLYLHLYQNELIGPLPEQIGNSQSLTEILVYSNNLTETIPPSLGVLTNLTLLDIHNNNLSGSIPVELFNCTNLATLDMSYNQFSGQISPKVGQLTGVSYLALNDNDFSGSIPEQLEDLMVLQHFFLSDNNFSGSVPIGLANLRQLSNITLYNNHLSGPLPSKLGMLSNLTVLDVTNNAFNGTLPTGLCQNGNLQILDFTHNNFEGPIPVELINCGSLVRVRAGFNSLTSIPNYFGRNSQLQYLELSSNYFQGALPLELGLGSALSTLKLDNNRFSGNLSSELVFSNLPNLQNLNLSSNHFVGPIPPSLVNCTNLLQLDLSYNSFNGSIPHVFPSKLQALYLQGNELSQQDPNIFTNLPNLEFLNMAQNNLTGLIPVEIGELDSLEELILSFNQFSGTIPVELGSLKNLQLLDLSHNQLSGTIPPTLGTELISLQTLNVSYNDLTGLLPSSWIRFLTSNYDSFVGNPGLCLMYSIDGQCSNPPPHSGKKKITIAVLMAIVVGSIVSIVVLILVFGIFTYHYFVKSPKLDPLVALNSIEVVSCPGRQISFNNIMEATQNLSDDYIIGTGGHGTVYKAVMFDGSVVAVKKIPLLEKDLQIHKSFLREINTIGNVKHRNLVKLLGFCKWGEIGLLIYDYISNGDLFEALHNKVNGKVLDWGARLKIAEGIAHGLAYLHHDCVPQIIHRDIKSRNVLLDADLEAHIADFGIAKAMALKPKDDYISITTSMVEGTYGYMAPEYGYGGQLTSKVDVYSFGVVLLELLTGKEPVDPSFGELEHIIPWVLSTIGQNGPNFNENVLDPRLLNTATNLQKAQMFHVLKVALLCTKNAPLDRLTMVQVVEILNTSPLL